MLDCIDSLLFLNLLLLVQSVAMPLSTHWRCGLRFWVDVNIDTARWWLLSFGILCMCSRCKTLLHFLARELEKHHPEDPSLREGLDNCSTAAQQNFKIVR